MQKKRVAVLGASGYSGEELLRILLRHPACEIRSVTSRQNAGSPIDSVFPRFAGIDLAFSAPDADQIASDCDVAFLALPHGLAAEFAVPLLAKGVKVLDLSADFRIKNPETFQKYYKEKHPAPELLDRAVYGLPELYRDKIRSASLVACAGCYPTSIILPLAPLLASKAVSMEDIVVSSMSGVSGAGRKVELAYIFPECNESVRAYSPVSHRHIPEIEQELSFAAASQKPVQISFIPHLVPVNRGINSTIVTRLTASDESKIAEIYSAAYAKEPFVRLLQTPKFPDTKHVTMSNFCEIGYAFDKRNGKLVIASCIDNLTKGAAGQAVQCFNIICGLDEKTGLL